MVDAVRRKDDKATEALYCHFSHGLKYVFLRRLDARYVDDAVQECLVEVIEAIQNRGLTDPERLPGLVADVAKRTLDGRIDEGMEKRNPEQDVTDLTGCIVDSTLSPETSVIRGRFLTIAQKMLASMKTAEREALFRFYVSGQLPPEICASLAISNGQFRNIKYRAKRRFSRLCQSAMQTCKKPVVAAPIQKARRVA